MLFGYLGGGRTVSATRLSTRSATPTVPLFSMRTFGSKLVDICTIYVHNLGYVTQNSFVHNYRRRAIFHMKNGAFFGAKTIHFVICNIV